MLTIEGDRRSHARIPLTQPCKLCDPRSGKYIGGMTQDFSESGASIVVPRLLSIKPGDSVHIGIAMKRRQGLLRSGEMIRADVTRTVQTVDDHTLLGLRFRAPQVDTTYVDHVRAAA